MFFTGKSSISGPWLPVYWRVDFQTSDPLHQLYGSGSTEVQTFITMATCRTMRIHGRSTLGAETRSQSPYGPYGWMVETMGNPLKPWENHGKSIDNMGVSENSESHLTGKYGLHIYDIHSLAG